MNSVFCHGEVREQQEPEGFRLEKKERHPNTNEARLTPGGEPKVENDSVCFCKTVATSAAKLFLFFVSDVKGQIKGEKTKALMFDVRINEEVCGIELGGCISTSLCFFPGCQCVFG